MVGGGIFAVLGVVVSLAGPLYWLALSIAGLLAFLTARSYVRLAVRFEEGGGAFEYLRDLDRPRLAGGLGWLLLLGYTLTIALYAATFGSYLAHALGAGGAVVRFAAVGLVAVVVGINLRGTGSSASVEITAVLVELAILAGLVVGGLADWRLSAATTTLSTPSIGGLAMASAAVFVAYEGFQLTTYDWDEIDRPDRTLPRTVPIAVVVVVATYLLVATAVVMVLTGDGVVQAGEVALAVAGQEQFGTAGLVAITLAALFATGSAVNSTLFSTARLARRIAHDGELPAVIEDAGDTGVPRRALLVLGGVAAFVAVVGGLSTIVEAASLVFLVTFGLVNLVAATQLDDAGLLPWVGAIGCAGATIALVVRLVDRSPVSLVGVGVVALLAFVVREPLLARVRTDTSDG